MSDYTELIKRLRNRRICIQQSGSLDDFPLLKEAADAIESLMEDNAALNGTITNILEQIKDLANPRWIPVTERLPEKDGAFITAYSKGGVSQNWYMTFHHGGGKWYQNSEDTGEVTHWMPLPEPPKEG